MSFLKTKNYLIGIGIILLCLFFTNVQANAGEWKEKQKLVASDGADMDYFGSCVSISGDKAIVGAYDDDKDEDSGSAILFPHCQGS